MTSARLEGTSMETKIKPAERATGYKGLTEPKEALPAHYYFDRAHYERELAAIWFRNWIYVGRSEGLQSARTFRTFEIADQRVFLVRDEAGDLQGFFNTCRHRGAELCREAQGQLRHVDRELERLYLVQFNLTAERGVVAKRVEAVRGVLDALAELRAE